MDFTVNMKHETVTSYGVTNGFGVSVDGTINFTEAGILDRDEAGIREHLEETHPKCSVFFEERSLLGPSSIIRVYFDDIKDHKRMEFVADIDGVLIPFGIETAIAVDWIMDNCVGGVKTCGEEWSWINYVEIRNELLNQPFTDEDISEIQMVELFPQFILDEFETIVNDICDPNSHMEEEIQVLFEWAQIHAPTQEKLQFLRWLEGESPLDRVNTATTKPVDWFESAKGMDWGEWITNA